MTLRNKSIQGVAWTAVSQGFQLVMRLLVLAVLARLLTPDDFGLSAMALVFTNFMMIFRDFGLSAAIIQRKELTPTQLSTIFWLNVFTGIALTSILAFLAPQIAVFYKDPRLIPITLLLSTIFFISSFGNVQNALLIKA